MFLCVFSLQPSQTPPNHISTISSAMNSSSQAGSTNNSLLPQSLSEGTQKATTRASQDTTMPMTGRNRSEFIIAINMCIVPFRVE